jgi:hypothetical protein
MARWVLPLAILAALCGCGGSSGAPLASSTGSGSGGTGSSGSTSGSWTPGVFQPSSKFAALCAVPRPGTSDLPGSTVDENNWLRSWTHELYLWYDEVQDADPSMSTTSQYFQLMKTTQTTSSGAPKDRFHFTYPTSVWNSLSQSGVDVGYGLTWEIVQSTVRIAYLEPAANLPAATIKANLVRGDSVLAVDGVELATASDQTSIDTINAGLSPSKAGEQHTFTIQDPVTLATRQITLQAANVTSTPVLLVSALSTPAGEVGYILYNEQVATAEPELIDAIKKLQQDGVTNLILDLRYNGGGYLDLASELAYMIAGPNQTAGQTFELSQFNSQYPTTNPVTRQPLTPTLFHSTTEGLSSLPTGQPLPYLGLSQLVVITGKDTCSASESIINGLQGVDIKVDQIGSTTCGKPYGFYPQDNCGTTYFSIEFQGVNAKGVGGYGDGFSPANTTPSVGVAVPGCSVADDFSHALGDPQEGRLQAAINFLATGTCPSPPSGSAAPKTLAQRQLRDRLMVRSPLSEMRFLRK